MYQTLLFPFMLLWGADSKCGYKIWIIKWHFSLWAWSQQDQISWITE